MCLSSLSFSLTYKDKTCIHKYRELAVNVSWLFLIQKFILDCWGSGFSYCIGSLHKQTQTLACFVAHCCIPLSYRKDSWTPLTRTQTNSHTIVSPNPPKLLTDLMYDAWSLKRSHKGFRFSHSSTSFRPFNLSSSRSDFSWTTTQKQNKLVWEEYVKINSLWGQFMCGYYSLDQVSSQFHLIVGKVEGLHIRHLGNQFSKFIQFVNTVVTQVQARQLARVGDTYVSTFSLTYHLIRLAATLQTVIVCH